MLDEHNDDLLGEELEAMEEGAVSHQFIPRPKGTKKGSASKPSTKGSSRNMVPRGMPKRKAEFLCRGSPRSHGVSSLGDTEQNKNSRHNSSKKPRSSSHEGTDFEGSEKPQKLIYEDAQLELSRD